MKKLLFVILILFNSNKVSSQINSNLDESLQLLIEYISSQEFREFKNNRSDLELADLIYLKALAISKGDISESLLASTFATLQFDKMSINIPLLNATADLKLQEVDSLLFLDKNSSLPSYLFFDSPPSGDKDKLAHFFGNAFLAYNISIFNISKILGIFVELFEESFKVGGGLDSRDIEVNYLGEYFGKLLTDDKNILPSEVLTMYIIHHLKFYN